MNKHSLATIVALATAALPVWAQSQTGALAVTAPGKAVLAETVEIRAKVVSVDLANRLVNLKGQTGKQVTLSVGDEVRNLAQVKAGDEVVVRYLEALAIELKKGGGIRERIDREDAIRAEPGQKPAAAAGRQIEFVADVIAVDPKRQIVTVKGAKGKIVDLKLRDPEQIKLVKTGDQVQGTYTEAVAISVEPAPAAAGKK